MATKGHGTLRLWNRILLSQEVYNRRVRFLADSQGDAREYWTEKYLLGLVSEVDEVLREINWKRHRHERKTVIRSNLAQELADLSKYVISLWQLWGFTPEEALWTILEKSQILEKQLEQETYGIPPHADILIADLDGSVANFYASFIHWLSEKDITTKSWQDTPQDLHPDLYLGIPFPEYQRLKSEFEEEGQYRHLIPYLDAIRFIRAEKERGTYVIVYTARPVSLIKRVWGDTWKWLKEHGIEPDKLVLAGDGRVLEAVRLTKLGHRVTLLEDNPLLAARAVVAKIPVLLRKFPYNNMLWTHPGIAAFDNLDDVQIYRHERTLTQ